MISRIFHINVCVTDFDRSLAFYRDTLGMNVVEGPFVAEGPELARALGITDRESIKVQGAFLRWGSDPDATVLDLVQFIDPPPEGRPYPSLNNVGLARIAFKVADCRAVYEALLARGVDFMTPPVSGFRSDLYYCCFRDPDGTILELLQSD